MNKTWFGIIIAVSFLAAAPLFSVKAASVYTGDVSSEIIVQPDFSARVQQKLVLNNTSSQDVISALDLTLPFAISDLTVTLNDKPVAVRLEGRTLHLNFSPALIGLKQNGVVQVGFTLQRFVTEVFPVKRIYWPAFDYGLDPSHYTADIFYPQAWGDVSYASRDQSPSYSRYGYKSTEFKNNKEAFLSIGSFASVEINAQWNLANPNQQDETVRLAVPGNAEGQMVFDTLTGADKAYRDSAGNDYVLVTIPSAGAREGLYKGHIAVAVTQPEVVQTGNNGFLAKPESLDLGNITDDEAIYRAIVAKFTPELTQGGWKRLSIDESLKNKQQNSLDYANALVAAYRKNGSSAEVVYGLAYMPLTNELKWHFWVLLLQGQKWVQVDPFMEGLTGLDCYHGVPPERIIWGVLPDSDDATSLGFENYLNRTDLVHFLTSAQIPQVSTGVDAALDLTGKAYSGQSVPLQVHINNSSNVIAYADAISVEGVTVPASDLYHYAVLPQGAEVIPVTGVILHDPFYTGQESISGSVSVRVNNANKEVQVSKDIDLEVNYQALNFNFAVILILVAGISLYFRYFVLKRHRFKLTR